MREGSAPFGGPGLFLLVKTCGSVPYGDRAFFCACGLCSGDCGARRIRHLRARLGGVQVM